MESRLDKKSETSSDWHPTVLALHTVTDEVDGKIITSSGGPLDVYSYSLFKYGHGDIAAAYAEQLTELLMQSTLAARLGDDQQPLIVAASAYKWLRTAAATIAESVVAKLNARGIPTQLAHIHRSRLTEGDYGTMDEAQRRYWMANNGLSADPAVFHGRHVVVIDDIRITGSHEHAIWNLFADMGIKSLTNLFVIRLDPELARRDPAIENRLNHTVVKSLNDLSHLVWGRDSFKLTARTLKFILSQSTNELTQFLRKLPCTELRAVHLGLLDDGYHAMDTYTRGAQVVLTEVKRRKVIAQKAAASGSATPENKKWLAWDPRPYRAPLSPNEGVSNDLPLATDLPTPKTFRLFGFDISVQITRR